MAHEVDLKALWKDLDEYSAELDREARTLQDVWLKIAQIKAKNDQEMREILAKEEFTFFPSDTTIGLNVGGQLFETTVDVLTADPYSILAAMCRRKSPIPANAEGIFYIDRDWWLFRHILSFLRSGVLPRELAVLKELYKEASFYRLEKLQRAIEDIPVDQVIDYSPAAHVAASGLPRGTGGDLEEDRYIYRRSAPSPDMISPSAPALSSSTTRSREKLRAGEDSEVHGRNHVHW